MVEKAKDIQNKKRVGEFNNILKFPLQTVTMGQE
jgi:hypothetical protein